MWNRVKGGAVVYCCARDRKGGIAQLAQRSLTLGSEWRSATAKRATPSACETWLRASGEGAARRSKCRELHWNRAMRTPNNRPATKTCSGSLLILVAARRAVARCGCGSVWLGITCPAAAGVSHRQGEPNLHAAQPNHHHRHQNAAAHRHHAAKGPLRPRSRHLHLRPGSPASPSSPSQPPPCRADRPA